MKALPSRVRHLLIDRDGVLNVERPGLLVVGRADWEWIDGALSSLVRLAALNVRASIITNQSCIGKGLATAAQIVDLHASIETEVAAAGGAIAGFFVCPHAPNDGCDCRKPKPTLALRAIASSHVSTSETLMVGDMDRDLACGRAANVEVALVRTGKGARTESHVDPMTTRVFDDLAAVVDALTEARSR